MRVVVVYKQQTDYARRVEEFLHDFQYQTGHELETLDPETPDGVSFCKAYDLLEYPAIIAISADSQVQNLWKGLPLPTISEVSYYTR